MSAINESFETTNQTIRNNSDGEGIYEISTGFVILLCVLYSLISLCAVISNSMVIWIIIRAKHMRTVTNSFIANLAVADILIGAFAIPFNFQAALLQRWVLPWFMCSFCPAVQIISVNVSVFSLMAIALDRHRAVIHPLKARTSTVKSNIIIAAIWFVAIVLAIPVSIALKVDLVWNEETQDISKPFCHNIGLDPNHFYYYNHSLVVIQYVLPLSIITIAYTRIILRLNFDKTQNKWRRESTSNAMVEQNKRKVIKMLIIVVALFILCWLPYQMYNILQEIYTEINDYKYINVIWFGCHWLAMSNSCYNPFIYAIYSERFNAEFRYRFGICCCACCGNRSGAHRCNNTTNTINATITEYEDSQWIPTHSPNSNGNTEKRSVLHKPSSSSPASCLKPTTAGENAEIKLRVEKKIGAIKNLNAITSSGDVCDNNSIEHQNNVQQKKVIKSVDFVESTL